MVSLARRLIVLAVSFCGCVNAFHERGPYEEEFSLEGISQFEIRDIDGDLELRGVGDGVFVARGTGYALGADKPAALRNLEHARLTGRRLGKTKLMVFDPPLELAGLVELDMDRVCDLPPDIELVARLNGGNIAVHGLSFAIDIWSGGGRIELGLGQRDLRIRCRPDGGALRVDPGFEATVVEAADGSLLVTAGDPSMASDVRLQSAGGDIVIQLIAD